MLVAETSERVELRAASEVGFLPFGGDEALLFQLVQGRVEGAVADLQRFGGHLFQALADGPAVHRLEGEHLQQQEVEGALDEIGRLAHGSVLSVTVISVTEYTTRMHGSVGFAGTVSFLPVTGWIEHVGVEG